MGKERKKGRWSVEQRLEFIDFRLFWEGRVNRSDLVDHFGVSVPQASADLTQYQEQAKGNAVYDKYQKTYVAGPRFRPVFFEPSADRYLAQLRMLESDLLSEDETRTVLTEPNRTGRDLPPDTITRLLEKTTARHPERTALVFHGRRVSFAELNGRANRIARLLITQGVAANRIRTTGAGPDNPIASNSTAEGKAQNRRVEITLSPLQ